jgi:hypothetical protein
VRIAEALQTWDRAIDVNLQLLANSESQHTALMQQMFSGKRSLAKTSGEFSTRHLKELVRIDAKSSAPVRLPTIVFATSRCLTSVLEVL